jgi:hypothetical protein
VEVEDAFVQAKVVREIKDNEFTIRTSLPGVKVSFTMVGNPQVDQDRVFRLAWAHVQAQALCAFADGVPLNGGAVADGKRVSVQQRQDAADLPSAHRPARRPS